MTAKKMLPFVVGAGIVALIAYNFVGSEETTEEYIAAIENERHEKELFMSDNEESPFRDSTLHFDALKYFKPDVKYRVNAVLEPVTEKKMVVLPTSDGQEKKYLEYAHANFRLDDVDNRLLILEVVDPGPFRGTLFLAFADETSARETYGAGRYLDVKKTPGASTILLDFNKAYNPYCAYSDKFSCPFPPRENVLKIAIRAGEMKYHE